MNVVNITNNEFSNLKELELKDHIFNTEGQIYYFNINDNQYILKRLYRETGTIFSNKLYTINELIDNNRFINISELVIPEKLICIDNKIIGFILPYIENINFHDVLYSNDFTINEKIEYFKQIGEILEKMKKVRNNTFVKDFYLNDLHESNFILNIETNKINVVDLDSCKINNNLPFTARYLSPFSPINNIDKYKKITEEISIGGFFKPDYNTDLFCYIVMILNFLSKIRITNLSINDYFDYLEYLHKVGISHELIDKLSLIYSENSNENPYQLLEELINIIDKSDYSKYESSKAHYSRCKINRY